MAEEQVVLGRDQEVDYSIRYHNTKERKMPKRKKRRLPRKGWTWQKMFDARRGNSPPTELFDCERCDKTDIRFVHRLSHERWDETICVCDTCANTLEGTDDAEWREDYAAETTASLRRWGFSKNGRPVLRDGSFTAVVILDEHDYGTDYKYLIYDEDGPPIDCGHNCFYSLEDAKIAASDQLADLKTCPHRGVRH